LTSSQQTGNEALGSCSGGSGGSSRLLTGRDYYEDLCFKAVNQCVGRVVRHRGDYAAVVLLDPRWVAGPAEWAAIRSRGSSSSNRRKVPVQKLPGWLQQSYVPTNGDFGPALKQLAAFYKQQVQPVAAQPL
jgi:chromosome transmission fidelity protein 1